MLQPKDKSVTGKEISLECPEKHQMQIKPFLSSAVH